MKKPTKPKAFNIYFDTFQHVEMLTMEQRGELFTALYEYAVNERITEFNNGMVKMAFSFFKAQIKRDFEKYYEKCEINRANASSRKRSLTVGSVRSQEEKEYKEEEEKKEEKEIEKEIEEEIEEEIEKEIEEEIEKEKEEEIEEYLSSLSDLDYQFDSLDFMDEEGWEEKLNC